MKQLTKSVAAKKEDGSVLIIALIFTAAMGLVVGGIAQLAAVDLRNTAGTRDQRGVVYTADAAVKAAINMYRTETRCPTSDELPLVNGIATADRQVDCIDPEALPGDEDGGNQPLLAVIALPSAGEPGFSADSGGPNNVAGGMYSARDVAIGGTASLNMEGPLTARTGCTPTGAGSVVTDPDPLVVSDCNKVGPYPYGNDPDYEPAVPTAPAAVAVPACPASGPVTMPFGTYTDSVALNALFSGSCANRVFYFPPRPDGTVGVYYFDFVDSGDHRWTLVNSATKIVGGTLPVGQTLATVGALPAGDRCRKAPVPALVPPIRIPGVQFIFGGDSRILVQDGSVDLCAQYDVAQTDQEIAVYGLTDDHPEPSAPPGPTDLDPVVPARATSPLTDFSNPDAGKNPGGSPATAIVSSVAPARSITLDQFSVAIPPGSTINRVELQVFHSEAQRPGTNNLSRLLLTVTLTDTAPGGSTFTCASTPACLSKDPATRPPDSAIVTAQFPTIASLQNLRLVYTGSATPQGSNNTSFDAHLDGVRLLVRYTPPPAAPAFHRQFACIRAVPYPTAGSCPVLQTQGAQSNLSIHGTTYVPLAAVDVQLTQRASQVFGRGIIVRSLRSQITPSGCGVCVTYNLPARVAVPGGPRTVVFQATVEGNKRLRALVEFPADDSAPIVRSWSTMNEP
jgi:hypothetical protein